MKLYELKESVDHYLKIGHLNGEEEVLITLDERSVGCRAYANVEIAALGIDWEWNQFRLEPTEKLCRKGRSKDDALEMHVHRYIYDNRTQLIRTCPQCERKLKKGVNYCYNCGQNVSKGERITYEQDYRTAK